MTNVAVVLTGPMGAGKSTIGRRVARTLNLPFVDTDTEIQRKHGAIDEIFRRHGESYFRDREREAVADALASSSIVALGGGAVLDESTRAALIDHDVVLLTVAAHSVRRRISGSDRPLLAGTNPLERWQRITDERMPVYRSVADVSFDTSTVPMSAVADQIVAWVRKRRGEGGRHE